MGEQGGPPTSPRLSQGGMRGEKLHRDQSGLIIIYEQEGRGKKRTQSFCHAVGSERAERRKATEHVGTRNPNTESGPRGAQKIKRMRATKAKKWLAVPQRSNANRGGDFHAGQDDRRSEKRRNNSRGNK